MNEAGANLGILKKELEEARSQVAELKQATASKDLPDAAAILQEIRRKQEEQERRKEKRKKPKPQKIWTLKDIEETLEAIDFL